MAHFTLLAWSCTEWAEAVWASVYGSGWFCAVQNQPIPVKLPHNVSRKMNQDYNFTHAVKKELNQNCLNNRIRQFDMSKVFSKNYFDF